MSKTKIFIAGLLMIVGSSTAILNIAIMALTPITDKHGLAVALGVLAGSLVAVGASLALASTIY